MNLFFKIFWTGTPPDASEREAVNDLFALAPHLKTSSGPLVLVTLTDIEGSSYRRPGARMVVARNQTWGLLSGGCIEGEVAKLCLPILEGSQRALALNIDTRRFLGCDGQLSLWAEAIPQQFFSELLIHIRARTPKVCVTYVGDEERTSAVLDSAVEGAFNQPLLPRRRLFVFGSGPDVRPLLKLAEALDWEARQLVLSSEAEVGAQEHWHILPTAAHVEHLEIDPWTACVVMNHHFGRDAELLHALWSADTPFLGLLGSRKRRDQLLEELTFGRHSIDLESRTLYAPVGLPLGGEGAQQIALEICAQVQQVMSEAGTRQGA